MANDRRLQQVTGTVETPTATSAGRGRARPCRLIGGLAISQTVGYGVLYYAFAVLITPIADSLRASTAAVTGAITTSIVVSAAAAIPVGRWLDRCGGRGLMVAGSALGSIAVVAWSQVTQLWQLYGVFVLIGLAGAASLYEAAFPVVMAASRPVDRDRALLAVTIVGGFASTIFFPLTGLLLAQLGWRTTVLVFAGLLAVATLPAHLSVVPRHGRLGRGTPAPAHARGVVGLALRDSKFWWIGAAFVAQAAAVSAVSVLLVTYLRQVGHPATVAAFLSGLLGALSVAGRLLTTGLARRHGMPAITAVIFAIQAAGIIALPHIGRGTAGAAACVVGFGLGFGVATIARPAIIAARYGTARYATIAATMTLPITLAKAFAPLVAATVAPQTFLIPAGIVCLAGAGVLGAVRIERTPFAAAEAQHGDQIKVT
ncbi:MAG: MFS transporter [Betaproteobacteria bacterium]